MHLVAVPDHGAEIDADMAGKPVAGWRVNQHAQVGMSPFDVTPGQLFDQMLRPDRLQQRLGLLPGSVPVQDVDLDAHFSSASSSKLGVSNRGGTFYKGFRYP